MPTPPTFDGVIWVKGTHLSPGDMVSCEIIAAEGYDLVAQAPASAPPPRRRKTRPMPRRKPSASSLVILE